MIRLAKIVIWLTLLIYKVGLDGLRIQIFVELWLMKKVQFSQILISRKFQ